MFLAHWPTTRSSCALGKDCRSAPPWFYQVTTLQLEWEKLSQYTGDPKYAQFTRRAMRAVRSAQPHDGLHPMFIDPNSGAWAWVWGSCCGFISTFMFPFDCARYECC